MIPECNSPRLQRLSITRPNVGHPRDNLTRTLGLREATLSASTRAVKTIYLEICYQRLLSSVCEACYTRQSNTCNKLQQLSNTSARVQRRGRASGQTDPSCKPCQLKGERPASQCSVRGSAGISLPPSDMSDLPRVAILIAPGNSRCYQRSDSPKQED